ncbi:hypothetical protein [Rhizobium sp. AG207R]|uniref:hypothetical protein n=1 Tax=Rhizobium sp. AG207R TaxID=2802287 RepID=UPI003FA6FB58
MNRSIFETWVETQLSPTLSAGDVVILDNVGFHKSEWAEDLVEAHGAAANSARIVASRPKSKPGRPS